MPSLTICIDCGRSVEKAMARSSRCPRCLVSHKATRPAPTRSPEGLAKRAAHQKIITSRQWRRVAAMVKLRDGGCVRCGTTTNLTVHHTIPARRATDPFDPDICVTLCRSCHGKVERRAA